jgi:hypothetical protein
VDVDNLVQERQRSCYVEDHAMDCTGMFAISRRARALFGPRPTSTLTPFVRTGEEREPLTGPGEPPVWRRWIEVCILSGDSVYVFRAEGCSLTFDAVPGTDRGKGEILAEGFDPLCEGHILRCRGAEHRTTEAAPPELRKMAIDTCRSVAMRLRGFGVDRGAVARPWLVGRPGFANIVQNAPSRGPAEGSVIPELQLYAERKKRRKGKSGAPTAFP